MVSLLLLMKEMVGKRSTELDKLCDSRDEAIKYIKSLDKNEV